MSLVMFCFLEMNVETYRGICDPTHRKDMATRARKSLGVNCKPLVASQNAYNARYCSL